MPILLVLGPVGLIEEISHYELQEHLDLRIQTLQPLGYVAVQVKSEAFAEQQDLHDLAMLAAEEAEKLNPDLKGELIAKVDAAIVADLQNKENLELQAATKIIQVNEAHPLPFPGKDVAELDTPNEKLQQSAVLKQRNDALTAMEVKPEIGNPIDVEPVGDVGVADGIH